MSRDREHEEESKIETDDSWNRTFYGSPTVGGLLVFLVIVLFVVFNSKW